MIFEKLQRCCPGCPLLALRVLCLLWLSTECDVGWMRLVRGLLVLPLAAVLLLAVVLLLLMRMPAAWLPLLHAAGSSAAPTQAAQTACSTPLRAHGYGRIRAMERIAIS